MGAGLCIICEAHSIRAYRHCPLKHTNQASMAIALEKLLQITVARQCRLFAVVWQAMEQGHSVGRLRDTLQTRPAVDLWMRNIHPLFGRYTVESLTHIIAGMRESRRHLAQCTTTPVIHTYTHRLQDDIMVYVPVCTLVSPTSCSWQEF